MLVYTDLKKKSSFFNAIDDRTGADYARPIPSQNVEHAACNRGAMSMTLYVTSASDPSSLRKLVFQI